MEAKVRAATQKNYHSTLTGVALTSDEANTSGKRKLSSDHSSCRLFCSGVPVKSRRFVDRNSRTISDSYCEQEPGHLCTNLQLLLAKTLHLLAFHPELLPSQKQMSLPNEYTLLRTTPFQNRYLPSSLAHLTLDFSFFILWASSITRYLQLNFLNTDFSLIHISYDVTSTSHSPGMIVSLMSEAYNEHFHTYLPTHGFAKKLLSNFFVRQTKCVCETRDRNNPHAETERTRLSWSPIRQTARSVGTQRLISFIQFDSVDFGAMTRCGDGMFR